MKSVLSFAGLALGLASIACGGGTEGSGGSGTGGSVSSGGGGAGGTTESTTGGASSTSSTGGSGTGGVGGTGGTGGTSGTTTTGTPVGCLTDVSAGHHKVSCDGGITYDVEIPAACVGGPCGLIVDMHGYTMTGDSEDENTGMRALGQQHGYVIVQPTAPKDNFQYPSWDQLLHAPLVYQFLVDLAASLPIDANRIHAMGFSQGGGMTFRLLCGHADFFASAAPASALPGCEFTAPNTPSEEIDILQVHGLQDPIVSFPNQALPQRNAALLAWPFGDPAVFEDDGMHKATRWTTPTGTVYEFWEHNYVTSATALFVPLKGHCVPGGADFSGDPAGYSCEDINTFVFGELAVAFFEAHPKN